MGTSLKSNIKLLKLKSSLLEQGLLRSRIKTIVSSSPVVVNSIREGKNQCQI